jgi:hypothetical protein
VWEQMPVRDGRVLGLLTSASKPTTANFFLPDKTLTAPCGFARPEHRYTLGGPGKSDLLDSLF